MGLELNVESSDEGDSQEMVPLKSATNGKALISNEPQSDQDQKEPTIDLFSVITQLNKAGPIEQFFLQVWRFTFNPEQTFHKVWDTFVLLLVIYSGFWEPFKAAYSTDQKMMPIEWLVDILFYCDMLINFNTGYDSGAGIVKDKKLIAIRYFKYWFWIDLVATVEWDQIFGGLLDGNETGQQVLSCFRLFKVLRLAKFDRLIARLTASWTIHTGYIEALKFFFYVFIVAHLLACFFYFWPKLWPFEEEVCDPIMETFNTSILGGSAWVSHDLVVGQTCETITTSWKDGLDARFAPAEDGAKFAKYIDCMYWAITTMTTIGYGDRSPANSHEIVFVLFAEVFGLTFFALLLTQINNLNDVLGAQVQANNEIKNEIIGFMKHHDMNAKLITKIIKFLNFKANSRSGNEFHESDGGFAALSPPLKYELRVALLKPYLMKVNMFGHDPADIEEEEVVKKRFTSADEDGGGSLTLAEIKQLIEGMTEQQQGKKGCCSKNEKREIKMSDEDIEVAFKEMDADGEGEVECDEFVAWHLFKKHKKSKLPKAPECFIRQLAYKMNTIAYSHGDQITKPGRYGSKFTVLLSGRATIFMGKYSDIVGSKKKGEKKKIDPDVADPSAKKMLKISSSDREPAIGMLSFLDNSNFKRFKKTLKTEDWECRADKFCDACYISRHDLQEVIAENWPEVQEPFVMLAAYFYGLKTATDALAQPVILEVLGTRGEGRDVLPFCLYCPLNASFFLLLLRRLLLLLGQLLPTLMSTHCLLSTENH